MGVGCTTQWCSDLAVTQGSMVLSLPSSYSMLMRPNKTKITVHGCHCPGDIALHVRKVLTRVWVGVRALALSVSLCDLITPDLEPRVFSRMGCTCTI